MNRRDKPSIKKRNGCWSTTLNVLRIYDCRDADRAARDAHVWATHYNALGYAPRVGLPAILRITYQD